MRKKQSTQHKIDRVRPPRVHITYDVEVGGAIELKELPFVVGVMGDFSGKPEQPLRRHQKSEIRRDRSRQFRSGSGRYETAFSLPVDNKLADDDSKMAVELKFNDIEDFEPDQLVQQVEPLRKLVEARRRFPICSRRWTATINWKAVAEHHSGLR